MFKKIIALFCAFTVAFSFLYTRIYSIIREENIISAANTQNSFSLNISTTRAAIYDCNMNKLVNNNVVYKYAIVPSLLSKESTAVLLEKFGEEFYNKIKENKPFILTSDEKIHVSEDVNVFEEYNRYNDDDVATHIIGYLDYNGNGVSGIECAFNDYLRLNSKSRNITYEINAKKEVLAGSSAQISDDGNDKKGIVLTIDGEIQKIIEEAGEETIKKGAIVVMDPYSGEIKGSASFPKINRNDIESNVQNTDSPFLNRALCAYSIGSVFKIVLSAVALEQDESKSFSNYCSGKVEMSDSVFLCHKKSGHGLLNIREALMQSCNPFFIALGQRLGFAPIKAMAQKLGFSKEVSLANGITVSAGTLPLSFDVKTDGDLANFSFGQGKTTVSPISVACMLSAVVNCGKCPEPILVKGISDEEGNRIEDAMSAVKYTQAMTADTAGKLKDYMVDVVTKGTGSPARPTYKDAGGKTGSAQTGQYDENGEEMINAWFAGFYPSDIPKYVIVVLCENGMSGSLKSGPIFKKICDEIETRKL